MTLTREARSQAWGVFLHWKEGLGVAVMEFREGGLVDMENRRRVGRFEDFIYVGDVLKSANGVQERDGITHEMLQQSRVVLEVIKMVGHGNHITSEIK